MRLELALETLNAPEQPAPLEIGVESETHRLVRSAAHAADSTIAAFLRCDGAAWSVPEAFGLPARAVSAAGAAWIAARLLARPSDEVIVVNDLRTEPGCDRDVTRLFGPAGPALRFLAAVRVETGAGHPGMLVVADARPRAGLSSAMLYVLRTHAKQLAVMQGWAARADGGMTERLRLLESVVVHANDAVLITQAEPIQMPGPEIVYCNAAFTRTTGYTEAEIIGKTPRILQSPDTDRAALDRLRTALTRWEPIEVELLNQRKDGTPFWVELSIVPVANERGWFTHWVSVQRDVTERKAAEETAVRARMAEMQNAELEAEIRERKSVEARLLYTAFHDDLTRLRNRAYFMDRLTSALAAMKDGPANQCAVLFMDVDKFKLVNDSLGHRAGDLMLMEVANRLRACVRPQDTLARLGGDEFALLIEGRGDLAPATDYAERIIDALAQPIWLGKQEVFATCSIGIAQASRTYDHPEEMLRDADIAMYNAKRGEPGSYSIFGTAMHDSAVEALELQTGLRHAITRNEFFLCYQPICDALTRRIVGVEALIRWDHPLRGVVAPGAFIETAEESGFIRDIGRWVLRESCRHMQAWRQAFPALGLHLSVNVSGKQLRDEGFVQETRDALRDTGLDPAALQLEVTESVFLQQPEAVGRTLSALRESGIRIALDDFGTGYSSLSFIDRYVMDTIKIDQSFVGRMLEQSRTMAVVRSIAQMGRGLGLDIVAEGIETEAQLAAVQANGCNAVQGYLLGRPMPAADLVRRLSIEPAPASGRAATA